MIVNFHVEFSSLFWDDSLNLQSIPPTFNCIFPDISTWNLTVDPGSGLGPGMNPKMGQVSGIEHCRCRQCMGLARVTDSQTQSQNVMNMQILK